MFFIFCFCWSSCNDNSHTVWMSMRVHAFDWVFQTKICQYSVDLLKTCQVISKTNLHTFKSIFIILADFSRNDRIHIVPIMVLFTKQLFTRYAWTEYLIKKFILFIFCTSSKFQTTTLLCSLTDDLMYMKSPEIRLFFIQNGSNANIFCADDIYQIFKFSEWEIILKCAESFPCRAYFTFHVEMFIKHRALRILI